MTFTTRTGLANLDYLNGQIILLDDGTKQLFILELVMVVLFQVVGKSGSGKSTLAAQIATNIIRRYENGL